MLPVAREQAAAAVPEEKLPRRTAQRVVLGDLMCFPVASGGSRPKPTPAAAEEAAAAGLRWVAMEAI